VFISVIDIQLPYCIGLGYVFNKILAATNFCV